VLKSLDRSVSHSPPTKCDIDVGSLLRLLHCSCLSHSGVDATPLSVGRWTDGQLQRKLYSRLALPMVGDARGVDRLPGDGSRRFADDITGGRRWISTAPQHHHDQRHQQRVWPETAMCVRATAKTTTLQRSRASGTIGLRRNVTPSYP